MDPKSECTAAELAAVLGLTRARIYQLASDAVLLKTESDNFELADSVQRYIAQLQRNAVTEEDIKIDKAKRASEATIKAAKAQIIKMEVQELKGELHRAEDVQAFADEYDYTVRNALLALPSRIAMDAAHKSATEVSVIVRQEVHKIMKELSEHQYDPEAYAERVRARRKWNGTEDADED